MQGVVEGFATISFVVVVGWLLAHLRVVGADSQRTLSLVTFWVCTPALLLGVMQRTPLEQIFSLNLLVAALTVLGSAGTYLVVGAVAFRGMGVGRRVIAAMCASYVNAGNLGIAIALYVLGDIAWMAPVLLLQLLVLTPLIMTVMDRDAAARRPSVIRTLASLVRNPITLGALAGLVLAITGWQLPRVIADPVAMLGDMAVPTMLLAFGVSLRLGPRAGASGSRGHVALLVALKLVVMPLMALGIGLALGMSGTPLMAAVITASLPTAQNVFVYAVRYDRAVVLARDAVFFSTFGSLGVILLVAFGFHAAGI